MSIDNLMERPTKIDIIPRARKISIRKSSIVVWLLILAPLTGILKGITGSRYAPLGIDVLLFTFFLLTVVDNLRKRRFDLLDLLYFSFLALAILEMFNPNVPSLQAGIEGFRKFAFMSITFYLGRRFLDVRAIEHFQSLLVVFSFLIALYGVKQFFQISELDYRIIDLATADITTYMMGGHLRPFSTLPGPFHLGLYLVVAILWIATSLMYSNSSSKSSLLYRLFLIAVLAVDVLALFFTRTKSSWIGLVAGFLVLALLQRQNIFKRLRKVLVISAVSLGAIALVFSILPPDSLRVLDDAIYAVTNITNAPTFDIREVIWETEIIPAMQEKPIVGFGTSSAGEGLSNLYEFTKSRFFPSHNLYFKITLELGLFGLVLFGTLVGIPIFRGYRTLKNRKMYWDGRQPLIIVWCLAVVVAFLVAAFANAVLDAYPANYYFWLCLGILAKGHAHWIRSVT